ncbi:23398_t:CDS:2, partial [Racocetra persica]
MTKINIAIDRYIASGKSSMCELLAERLNYQFIDNGLFYRYIALNFSNLEEIRIISWLLNQQEENILTQVNQIDSKQLISNELLIKIANNINIQHPDCDRYIQYLEEGYNSDEVYLTKISDTEVIDAEVIDTHLTEISDYESDITIPTFVKEIEVADKLEISDCESDISISFPVEQIKNSVDSSVAEEHVESFINEVSVSYSPKKLTPKQKGDKLELFLLQLLRENSIDCNVTRTVYFVNSIFTSIGDSRIDLFGNYRSMNYIMQVKNKVEKYKVEPSDIQEFSGVLAKQAEGTIGFFVTNTTYSLNAHNEASNSKQQIILCHKDNVIEKIKATKLKLENKELQKNSFELNDLVIKNLEIDSDESTVYLF